MISYQLLRFAENLCMMVRPVSDQKLLPNPQKKMGVAFLGNALK